MDKLHLPSFEYSFQKRDGKLHIFDVIRKKYVVLTPEEWVRQHFIHYLVNDLKYPKGLIRVEADLKYHVLEKRADIVVYNRLGEVMILIECKSSHVTINQKVFDQAATYNKVFKAKFLVVTNGLKHFCCEIDYKSGRASFMEGLPTYERLTE